MSGQRKALIVANDEYAHLALRNLLAPAADAEALGRVLGDRQIGDFAVQVVRNEPAHIIQAQIEELFSESLRDDVLLLHFSGHGLKNQAGELFFAASNTRPNRLGSTAVSADFVQRCMRASRSRSIVLLLDCCYGGAFAQGIAVRASGDVNVLDSFPQERSGGRGRAVITASTAMEYAFEGDQLADNRSARPSVFTSALVEGLATGDADRDEDGWVSLNELYDYVFEKVRDRNPHQTPSRAVEMQGELYLARSRRRRIDPAPLPPDLQAAVTDPNMYTRLGAVLELRARLISDNLPAAASAYETLAELSRTDIRYVADPAAEALMGAALHPEETQLNFGELRQGSEPPHRLVRLLGPPIARFCVPRASADWIGINETAEGLDISADTGGTGSLHGSLDLKGPTGEAVIAIDINLVPAALQQPTAPPPPPTAPPPTAPPPTEPAPTAPPPSEPARTSERLPVESEGAGPQPGKQPAHPVPVAEPQGTETEPGAEHASQPGAARSAWYLAPAYTLQVGQRVSAIAYSPDSTSLATGSRGRVRIWNLQDANVVQDMQAGRTSTVRAISFSPNGRWLAGAVSDRTVRIWATATGKQQHLLHHNGGVTAVAFSPDGTLLATGSEDSTARIWDATGQQRLRITHTHGVTAVAFSPDGTRLATSYEDAVALWDPSTGQQQLQVIHSGKIRAMAFSPDGNWLVTGGEDRTARIWNATTGKHHRQLVHIGYVSAVAFTPDSAWLATGSTDTHMRIWDATSGQLYHQIKQTDGATALAFAPDGARLAVVWGGKTVYFWDVP